MGCGYSKQTPEGGQVPTRLHSFHLVPSQETKKCRDPAMLQGDGAKRMSIYESAKKEDSISIPQFNDHVGHESLKASAEVVGAKTDARVLTEKTFKMMPEAFSDNQPSKEPDRYPDEMQMNKDTTGPHEKDGYVRIQLEMVEDEEVAVRLSNVKIPTANEVEPAKETLDGSVKTFAADNTKQQPQELKGSSANEQQEFIREEEDYHGNDDDDRDIGRRIIQTNRNLSSVAAPSFRVYCVPPSSPEIDEDEEESGADSDGQPAHKRRISDSFGSILSVSSWSSSNEVVETSVKKVGRKKKFGKALMEGPVAMRNLLICKA